MRRLLAFLAVAAITWFAVRLQQADSPTASTGESTSRQAPPAPHDAGAANRSQGSPATSNKGFRDQSHLEEHFAKHGREFPGVNREEYLELAQTLRDATPGGNILEVVRPGDGVISRFDRGSGAFIAFDRDGTIRTFFKPNDGERYFRRQANRTPNR